LNPNNAETYYNKGLTYANLGDKLNAVKSYTKCIQIDAKYFQAYVNRGNIKNSEGKFSEALKDFNVAAKLNPTFALIYYNIAVSKAGIGDTINACVDLKKCKSLGFKATDELMKQYCK
jgi:tetratricopeptide (TPR) repeat protein